MKQREGDPVFGLEAARRCELILGVIDADGPRAAAGEPGGDVGGAAAELDRVLAGEVGRQQADLGLRNRPDPPFLIARRESPASLAVVDEVDRPLVPGLAVASDVVGQLGRRVLVRGHPGSDDQLSWLSIWARWRCR